MVRADAELFAYPITLCEDEASSSFSFADLDSEETCVESKKGKNLLVGW